MMETIALDATIAVIAAVPLAMLWRVITLAIDRQNGQRKLANEIQQFEMRHGPLLAERKGRG